MLWEKMPVQRGGGGYVGEVGRSEDDQGPGSAMQGPSNLTKVLVSVSTTWCRASVCHLVPRHLAQLLFLGYFLLLFLFLFICSLQGFPLRANRF